MSVKYILYNKSIHVAEEAIRKVLKTAKIYGKDSVVYNVHLLLFFVQTYKNI